MHSASSSAPVVIAYHGSDDINLKEIEDIDLIIKNTKTIFWEEVFIFLEILSKEQKIGQTNSILEKIKK